MTVYNYSWLDAGLVVAFVKAVCCLSQSSKWSHLPLQKPWYTKAHTLFWQLRQEILQESLFPSLAVKMPDKAWATLDGPRPSILPIWIWA